MKTFAHINPAGDIVGIGMIYMESGGFTEPVAIKVAELGEDAGIKSYGDSVKADPTSVTVIIDTAQMPGDDPNTYDKTFRGAFKHVGGVKVDVDLSKAKLITHDKRRVKRGEELAPLDVQATIPSQASTAEAARQAIRDKYAAMQTEIDACVTPEQLKSIILRNEL